MPTNTENNLYSKDFLNIDNLRGNANGVNSTYVSGFSIKKPTNYQELK